MTIARSRSSSAIEIKETTAFTWHYYVPGAQPGQTYGYRMYGPWEPQNGQGIDNTTYYKLVLDNPRYYMDYTGTGNSLNVGHPQVLKLISPSRRAN